MTTNEVFRQKADKLLHDFVQPDAIVYSILRLRDSNETRVYDFYVIHENRMVWISAYIRSVLDIPWSERYQAVLLRGGNTAKGVVSDLSIHLGYSVREEGL